MHMTWHEVWSRPEIAHHDDRTVQRFQAVITNKMLGLIGSLKLTEYNVGGRVAHFVGL